MPNEIRPAGALSEQEVIEWLKKKPRTFGWDALVVYDRNQANTLLLQQYIDRYAVTGYFEPINGRITIDDGKHWEYMYDTVLDSPRLSFEESRPGSSFATLTMHIVGGAHLTVKQPDNSAKHVERIDWYDPVQGPRVVATIDLEDSDGNVSEDGRVILDLSKGVKIKLTYGTTGAIQQKGGDFFQGIFDGWDDDRKIFVLNTLMHHDEVGILDPEEFRIRAMPAPGANVRGGAGYGNGAVMVFVAARGSSVGSLPDAEEEWEYLIPNGYSTALLVGNRYTMEKIISAGVRTFAPDAELELIASNEPGDPIRSIRALSGDVDAGNYWLNFHGNFSLVFVEARIPLAKSSVYGDGSLVISVEDSIVKMAWSASSSNGTYQTKLWQQSPSGESFVDLAWELDVHMKIGLGFEGKLNFEDWATYAISCTFEPRGELAPIHSEWWEFLLAGLMPVGRRKLRSVRAGVIFRGFDNVDLFRVHGLLFEGDRIVRSRSVHMPMDLVLFGDLAPVETSFAIEPMEDVVGTGSTLQFAVRPAQTGLSWRVERVPGYEGELGTITAEGKYTASSTLPAGKPYTMVRVVASSDGRASSALIRVVARAVVVNPLVVTASKTGGNIHMSGGAIDRGALEWSIKSKTGASLTDVPPDLGAEFDENDRYYVPGSGSTEDIYSVDEVTARNPRSGDSHTSYVLMIELPVNTSILINEEAGLPAGQLQFELHAGSGAMEEVVWTVVAGGGSITPDGVYTIDEASLYRFAVITGVRIVPGIGKFHNYMILPVPLIDLEEFQRVLK